jgi:transcriptional regulator with GAF, ATPase, and Fis domain
MDKSAMRIFLNYHWPGNVRELEHAIEHAFVLSTMDDIMFSDLPVELTQLEQQLVPNYSNPTTYDASITPRTRVSTKDLNRELLWRILKESGWNKAEAGRRLSLSRASIWKYMKKWDIPMEKPEDT